jgi:hypothetical protein
MMRGHPASLLHLQQNMLLRATVQRCAHSRQRAHLPPPALHPHACIRVRHRAALATLILSRIFRLNVLALNYPCSTVCQNIGVGKFALELVFLRYHGYGVPADMAPPRLRTLTTHLAEAAACSLFTPCASAATCNLQASFLQCC